MFRYLRFQFTLTGMLVGVTLAAILAATWRYSSFPGVALFLVVTHLGMAAIACLAFDRLVRRETDS